MAKKKRKSSKTSKIKNNKEESKKELILKTKSDWIKKALVNKKV